MKFERILVPMDFSHASLMAFDAALEHFSPGRIFLLYVLDVNVSDSVLGPNMDFDRETHQQDKAYERLNSLARSAPTQKWKIETLVSFGQPVHEIVETAKNHEIDLIIMGSHGSHSLTKDIFGHCAHQVSRKAECSTWILKVVHTAKEESIPKKVANL